MIIKTTFNDNDFTHTLEDYWNGFWFRNYYLAINLIDGDDEESLRKYRDTRIEAEDLLQKAFYHESEMTVSEVEKFTKIIEESILAFIKLKGDYEYLKKNLKVMVRLSITDKEENGEVVYYFLKHKKYITM